MSHPIKIDGAFRDIIGVINLSFDFFLIFFGSLFVHLTLSFTYYMSQDIVLLFVLSHIAECRGKH